MKKGWKVLILVIIIGTLIEWGLIAALMIQVRGLQEDRNRAFTYIGNCERMWSKQTTFNREYYFKNHNPKRADKEWPLERQSPIKK